MDLDMLRRQWDRAAAAAALVSGVVLLIAGYLGISHTAYPAEQIPYMLSAGCGAVFLLGVAATLWISADLRDEWCKLDEIRQLLDERPEDVARAAEPVMLARSPAPTARRSKAGA